MAKAVAVVIALAPTPAVKVVAAAQIETTVAADPIVELVGVAMAVPEEFVAVTAPTAAVPIVVAGVVASTRFVEVTVAVQG